MIRAIVEVTKYTTSGWDDYADTYEEAFDAKTKKKAECLALERVKTLNAAKRTGDFGITLCSYDARIIRFEQVNIIEEI